MPIDPERLLAWDIPEVEQTYGLREVATYALSVGMGQDPTDLAALAYTGALADDVRVMPAFACVLGHPGFWLADPATGVDATRVLHGEQGMVLHAPLPATATVRAKTRVTSLTDRGRYRGAVLTWQKDVREAATGAQLATCTGTSLLRGDGGFGEARGSAATGGAPAPAPAPHRVPTTAPDRVVETPTRPEQALLYRWNGDPNPLHLDPRAAARAGFAQPILHGLCTFGVAAGALLAQLCGHDAARFGAMRGRFTAPVLPGDTLRTEIWFDGSFRTRAVERDRIVLDRGHFAHGPADRPGAG